MKPHILFKMLKDLDKHQQEVKDIKDEILSVLAEIGEAKANIVENSEIERC